MHVTGFSLLLLVGSLAVRPLAGAEREKERQISVVGRASVNVTPNEVSFRVSVEQDGEDLDQVRAETDRALGAALRSLKKSGVSDKDVVTTDLELRRSFSKGDEQTTVTGRRTQTTRTKDSINFTLKRGILVKLRKVEGAENIVAGLMKLGANNIGSFEFGLSNAKQREAEALELAAKDAVRDADTLAAQFGAKRGRVLTIVREKLGGGGGDPGKVIVTGAYVPGSESPAAFSPGTMKIEAVVSATFELE